MEYLVVKTEKSLRESCEYFKKSDVIGLDVETTELEPWLGELRLIQVSNGKKTVIIDVRALLKGLGRYNLPVKENYHVFAPLKELLESGNVVVTIHNCKFEYKWLISKCDIAPQNVFDTMLASQHIDYSPKDNPNKPHNLAAVARRFIGLDLDKTEQRSDWGREVLSKEQLDYAALDVYHLPDLQRKQQALLESDRTAYAHKLDCESVETVVRGELVGHAIDVPTYSHQIEVLDRLRDQASKKLQATLRPTTGIELVQPSFFDLPDKDYGEVLLTSASQMLTALSKLGVPVFSSKDLAEIEKHEKAGLPYAVGTGMKALAPLYHQYPVVELLADFRGVEKLVSSFGPTFLERLVTDEQGVPRIHPDFSIIGAPTGRMSCRNPNLQQIPSGEVKVGDTNYNIGLREAFIAPAGRALCNADYSQIELRIAANESLDPIFMDAFHTGRDLHALTASSVFGVPYEECADESHEFYHTHRSFSKRINFGILYGIGPGGLGAQLKITSDEAYEIIQKHRSAHPILWEYLDRQAKKATTTLMARTASGRLQRFERPSLGDDGLPLRKEVSAIGRNGKNMPIQGCIPYYNRILVEGKGFIPIGEAGLGEASVWDGKKFVRAQVTKSGKKKIAHVKFENGLTVDSSHDHYFKAIKYRNTQWLQAKNLTKKFSIACNEEVETFHYLDFSVPVDVVGICASSYFLFGKNNEVTISDTDYVLKQAWKTLLGTYLDSTIPTEKHKSTRIKETYKISGASFVTELVTKDGFHEDVWKSSILMKAILNTLFSFATKAEKEIMVKLPYKLAKDVQVALLLFGIKATVSKGIATTRVVLRERGLISFVKRIGTIDVDSILKYLTMKDIDAYVKAENLYDLTLPVANVTMTDEEVEMFDVVDSETSEFMTQGVVTHNTSADILKRALKLLGDALRGKDAYVVNIVHDEITVECDAKIAEEVRVILQESMKNAGEEFIEKVPVKVDAKIIKSWADK